MTISLQNTLRTESIGHHPRLTSTLLTGAASIGALTDQANADLLATLQHDGHTYHVYDDAMTWQQASAFASGLTLGGQSGYLTRIDDAAENAALYSLLLEHDDAFEEVANDGGRARYVWIGASDLAAEGVWRWANNNEHFWQGNKSGSVAGGFYNNWGTTGSRNEPDNFNNQDAAAIALDNWPVPSGFLGTASQWNDIDAGNRMPFIVEFDFSESMPDLQVTSLSCDHASGTCTLSFLGAPSEAYRIVQSNDLDFTETATVLPDSALIGSVDEFKITTAPNGIATVIFPLESAPRRFLRVEIE